MLNFFGKIVQASLILLILTGCANLKGIHEFATSSVAGVQGYETLPYNFRHFVADSCKAENIRNLVLDTLSCPEGSSAKIDQVDALIEKTIAAYLNGLSDLAADHLTAYQFDSLSAAINNSELNVHIPKKQSEACTRLSNILLKAVTDGYRRNRIKDYIRNANEPFKNLIYYLNFNLSVNLARKLRIEKIYVKSNYVDMFRNKSTNDYDKRQLIKEYYLIIDELNHKEQVLKAYALLLQNVADGHQKLYDHLDKINQSEIKTAMFQYAHLIQEVDAQVKMLK